MNLNKFLTYNIKEAPKPLQKGGCSLFLDSKNYDSFTFNLGKASDWKGDSGNNNNFTQVSSVNQPTYTEAGIANKPVLDFNGNNKLYQAYDAILNTPLFTIFVVCQVRGDQGSNRTPYNTRSRVSNDEYGYNFYANGSNKWSVLFGVKSSWNVAGEVDTVVLNETVILVARVSSLRDAFFSFTNSSGTNNYPITLDDDYAPNTVKGTYIGAGENGDLEFNGYIADTISYNVALSDNDVLQKINELKNIWAV